MTLLLCHSEWGVRSVLGSLAPDQQVGYSDSYVRFVTFGHEFAQG